MRLKKKKSMIIAFVIAEPCMTMQVSVTLNKFQSRRTKKVTMSLFIEKAIFISITVGE